MKVTPLRQQMTPKADGMFIIPLALADIEFLSKPARRISANLRYVKEQWPAALRAAQSRIEDAKPCDLVTTDVAGEESFYTVSFLLLPGTDLGEAQRDLLFQKAGRAVYASARDRRARVVALDCSCIENASSIGAIIEGILLADYRFDRYRKKPARAPYAGIEDLHLHTKKRISPDIMAKVEALDAGVRLARDLGNMPASDCTPSFLVKTAQELARAHKLEIKVFDRKGLEQLGAGGILSVSNGSAQEPALIRLRYKHSKPSRKTIALVGKGVTFDSGGVCVKPGAGMDDMILDMAGAAAVLGAMKAIALLGPSIAVTAYVPATENMVDGRATKPGDVIRIINGTTVEVVNTDAEGRLILADAMCLAESDGCDEIIDIATLTGAAVIALGVDCAALFSADDVLAEQLLRASQEAHEYLWRMPLIAEYREHLKSRTADLKNIGDKSQGGGSISGALFLQEFIKKARWAHLDIAGPALRTAVGKDGRPGASGYGVRTLVRYVLSARR